MQHFCWEADVCLTVWSAVCRLEMSKRKYDSAKQRVAKLHSEFDKLKSQLEGQVCMRVRLAHTVGFVCAGVV